MGCNHASVGVATFPVIEGTCSLMKFQSSIKGFGESNALLLMHISGRADCIVMQEADPQHACSIFDASWPRGDI